MRPYVRPLLILATLLFAACGQEAPKQPEPRSVTAKTVILVPTEARECTSLPGQVQSRNSVTLSSKLSGTVVDVMAREGTCCRPGSPSCASTTPSCASGSRACAPRPARPAWNPGPWPRARLRPRPPWTVWSGFCGRTPSAATTWTAPAPNTRPWPARRRPWPPSPRRPGSRAPRIRALLQYSAVTSPLDGVLSRRHVDLGAFVQAGTPLAEVEDLHSGFELVAQADESLLGAVERNMTVVALVPSLSEAPFLTTLSAVVGQVDPGSRSFRIKAALDSAPGPGMFGKVCVPVAQAKKLLAPESCLRRRGELTTALVVDKASVLRLRIVKTGGVYQRADIDGQTFILQTASDRSGTVPAGAETLVEVLSGLAEGDEVVVDAPDTAREGDRLVRG